MKDNNTGQLTIVLSYTFCQTPDEEHEEGCAKFGFNMDYYKINDTISKNCNEMLEPVNISDKEWFSEIKSARILTREKTADFSIPRASSATMQFPLDNENGQEESYQQIAIVATDNISTGKSRMRDIKIFITGYEDDNLRLFAFKLGELINDITKHRKNPKIVPIKARIKTKPGFVRYSRPETKFVLVYMQKDNVEHDIWNIYYKLIVVNYDEKTEKVVLNVEETEQDHRRKLNRPVSIFKFIKTFGSPKDDFPKKLSSTTIGPHCHFGYKYNMHKKRCEISECKKMMRGCLFGNSNGTECDLCKRGYILTLKKFCVPQISTVLKPVSKLCLHSMEIKTTFFKRPRFDPSKLDQYVTDKRAEQGLKILKIDCKDIEDVEEKAKSLPNVAPFIKLLFESDKDWKESTGDDDIMFDIFEKEDEAVKELANEKKDKLWEFIQKNRLINAQIKNMLFSCLKSRTNEKCDKSFLNVILEVLKNERPKAQEADEEKKKNVSLECHNMPYVWKIDALPEKFKENLKEWKKMQKKDRRIVNGWLVRGHKKTLSTANKSIMTKVVTTVLTDETIKKFQESYKTNVFDKMFEEEALTDSNNLLRLRQLLYDLRKSTMYETFIKEKCTLIGTDKIDENIFDVFAKMDRIIYTKKNMSLLDQYEKETNESDEEDESDEDEKVLNPSEMFNKKMTMIIKYHMRLKDEHLTDKETLKQKLEWYTKNQIVEVNE